MMKIKELTKLITSYQDRKPIYVTIVDNGWTVCHFKCLRGNISDFKISDLQVDTPEEEFITMQNISNAEVYSVIPDGKYEISIDIDIDDILPADWFDDEEETDYDDDEDFDESFNRKIRIR